MIIKNPIIPDEDSPPGVMPYTIPEPEDPEPEDELTPANVAPVMGNDAPRWKAVRPAAVKVGGDVYALVPTGWQFNIAMVGVNLSMYGDHLTPPQGLGPRGSITMIRSDGSYGVYYDCPAYTFSGAAVIPSQWEMVSTPPAGFTIPTFPGNHFQPISGEPKYYSTVDWTLHSSFNWGQPPIVLTWDLWNRFWKADHVLPEIMWSTDVYIQSYSVISYGLFKYTASNRRAWSGLVPLLTCVGLASLFGSVAAPQISSSAGRRRKYVKNDVY